MPHPLTDHTTPPAHARHPQMVLERDDAGRLYSPAMRQRIASLGAGGVRAEAVGAVTAADKMLTVLLDRTFEPLHLSVAQVKALGIIRHFGDGGCQMRTIAMFCNVTPRTTTGVVDGLEAAALVERVPDPADRRAVIVRLTPEGERRLDAAMTLQVEVTNRLLTGFTDEECDQLRHHCLRIVQAVNRETH